MRGSTKNRDEIFAQFGRYLEGTGGTFKTELKHVTADDDGRVMGVHHNSGTRNGKVLSTDGCITFTLRNGRLVEGVAHFTDQANWDAF